MSDGFTLKTFDGREWTCHLLGAGYNCPALKIYGEETERKLLNAMNRKIRKAMK